MNQTSLSPTPSTIPSTVPSYIPSTDPSSVPSLLPSVTPSMTPSYTPSRVPSATSTSPSITPSTTPSGSPSTDPSSVPSVLPSVTLSSTPSGVPSTLPSVFCADSTLKFIKKDGNYDLKCSWLTSAADSRCASDDVRTHCPLICGACDPCSDSKATFYLKKELSTCAIATSKKCKIPGLFHTCRATCGICSSLVPSTE